MQPPHPLPEPDLLQTNDLKPWKGTPFSQRFLDNTSKFTPKNQSECASKTQLVHKNQRKTTKKPNTCPGLCSCLGLLLAILLHLLLPKSSYVELNEVVRQCVYRFDSDSSWIRELTKALRAPTGPRNLLPYPFLPSALRLRDCLLFGFHGLVGWRLTSILAVFCGSPSWEANNNPFLCWGTWWYVVHWLIHRSNGTVKMFDPLFSTFFVSIVSSLINCSACNNGLMICFWNVLRMAQQMAAHWPSSRLRLAAAVRLSLLGLPQEANNLKRHRSRGNQELVWSEMMVACGSNPSATWTFC